MRRLAFALLMPAVLWSSSAVAEYRITRDHGGLLEDYKVKYAVIRDRGERVIITASAIPAARSCSASCRSTVFA
jgi:hypothetical protein